ncbi:hypothetical protein ALGA_0030 [Labilibaculum antarcticum]|uniref:Uncharacterized protein n=2 Tax=Labilibaculum antarcticum TaxID=1717717 RepID=A0A1Y1CDL6_9BACT|nr:hypothetical protein ALGA_0030 [Labilibaculum antarcticum]
MSGNFIIQNKNLKTEVKMPNRDGTGPDGKGVKTGRKLGNCKPQESANEEKLKERGLGNRRLQEKGNKRRQN